MKKIIGCLVIFMLILVTIPSTIALETNKKTDTNTANIGWTFLRGIITKPRFINGGNDVTFFAIYVHYRTHGIGINERGVYRGLQSITLSNDFIGMLKHHYVFAKFDGTMEHYQG
jgi:hypothetical protein